MRLALLLACAVVVSCEKREIALVEIAGSSATIERIDLEGSARRALTSPLPGTVSIPVELPEDAELAFSMAFVAQPPVPRTRVEFRIDLATEGRSIEVFRRGIRSAGANAWHEARIDLGAWSGQRVELKLSTGSSSEQVRLAWAEPTLRSRRTVPLRAGERPSFIVLLVDTLRPDYLGAYGFEGPISPNLDRLAAESVLFVNAFAAAPWTKPSIASLFTSLPPSVHGVTGMGKPSWSGEGELMEVLPGEAETLAERLQESGYQTAALVANPFISPRYGFSQGFETFERREETEALLAAAREWLAERADEGDAPFLLYLHLMDVHGPYRAPRPDFEAVAAMEPTGSRALSEEEYARIPAYLRNVEWADDGERYRLSSWRARYGAGIHALDRRIAPFLEELRTSGLLDRSYLVLTSDHGEELMEHGGWNHGDNLYDHQLHVPLLVRKPLARDAGRRVESLVSLLDLMPTLSALGGVESGSKGLGRDFSELLRGGIDVGTDAVFASAVNENPGLFAVRTRSHKLIWDEPRSELQLFDLAADPHECRNLATRGEPPLSLLKSYLREHLEASRARGALAPEMLPIDEDLRKRLEALGYAR